MSVTCFAARDKVGVRGRSAVRNCYEGRRLQPRGKIVWQQDWEKCARSTSRCLHSMLLSRALPVARERRLTMRSHCNGCSAHSSRDPTAVLDHLQGVHPASLVRAGSETATRLAPALAESNNRSNSANSERQLWCVVSLSSTTPFPVARERRCRVAPTLGPEVAVDSMRGCARLIPWESRGVQPCLPQVYVRAFPS